MNKVSIILLLIAVICIHNLYSQVRTNDTDSVDIILSSLISDSAKANALFKIISEQNSSKNYESAKNYSLKSLDYFKKKNNLHGIIKISEGYGDAFFRSRNFDSAIFVFRNSLALIGSLQDTEDKTRLAARHNERAAKAFERISYDSAIVYYVRANKLFASFRNNNTDSVVRASAMTMHAYSHLMTGNSQRAYEIAEQAAAFADGLTDNSAKAHTYAVLGTILTEMNLYDKAISNLETGVKYAMLANDSMKIASNINSIALVYLRQNDFNNALKNYYEAYRYTNTGVTHFQYITISYNIINLLCEMDSVEKAEYYLKNLEENVRKVKTDKAYFETLLSICVFYSTKGDISKAEEYMNKATELLPSFDSHQNKSDYYTARSRMYEAKGDFKKSLEDFQTHQRYKDSVSTRELEEIVAEKNTLYETEKKDKQIKLLEKDNELKAANELRAKQMRNFSFAGIAALIIFGAFTYYRYKQRKQLSEKLSVSLTELKETQQQLIETERQREQEKVRLRLSRDLHDDIGSTLSSINMLSRSAKKRMEEKDEVRLVESLEKIGERTQSTLDNMSDIIWSIKPENDSLANILSRMREYATTVLEAKKINYNIDFPADADHIHLLPDLKNNMFLVFKEAVNNLAKYSQCSKANIALTIQDKKIKMIVEDNGKGFDSSNDFIGNGLNNMKRRAEESGAVLNIASEKGKGARVEFVKQT